MMKKAQRRRAALALWGGVFGAVALAASAAEGCTSDSTNVGPDTSSGDTSAPFPDTGVPDTNLPPDTADAGGDSARESGPCPGGTYTTIDMLYEGGAGGAVLISSFDDAVLALGNVDGWGYGPPGGGNSSATLGAVLDDGYRCPGAAVLNAKFTDYGPSFGSQLQLKRDPATVSGDALDAGSVLVAKKLHFAAKVIIPYLQDAGAPDAAAAAIQATLVGVNAVVQWDKFTKGTYGDAFQLYLDGQWHEYVYTLDGTPDAVNDAGEFSFPFVNRILVQVATQTPSAVNATHSSVDGGLVAPFLGGGGLDVKLLVDDVWIEGPGATYTRH